MRNLLLTAHIVTSVGFLGAVGCFLALAIAGLNDSDPLVLRSLYLVLDKLTWLVVVPLSFTSLATGILSALCTPWGLMRHYWVLAKLLLTLLSTWVLMLHTRPIGYMAWAAARQSVAGPEFDGRRLQLVIASSAALAVLLAATFLSIYKPKGLTRYGWRKTRIAADSSSSAQW